MRNPVSDTLNGFFLIRIRKGENEWLSDIYPISLILLMTKPTTDPEGTSRKLAEIAENLTLDN